MRTNGPKNCGLLGEAVCVGILLRLSKKVLLLSLPFFAFSLFFGAHLCKLRSLGDDEIVGWAGNEEKKMSNRAVSMACKEERRQDLFGGEEG
jgi:hypothetical protein